MEHFYGSYDEWERDGPEVIEWLKSFRLHRIQDVVNFTLDYRGQIKVHLRLLHFRDKGTEIPRANSLTNWASWLEKNTSNITDLTVHFADQKLIEAIAKQPQIKKLVIEDGTFTDLSPLLKLTDLTYLEIHPRSVEIDFSVLNELKSLKVFHVRSRKVLRFETLSGLTQLEGLWIGVGVDPGFTGRVKVPNLNFLRPLTNLKRLRLQQVQPLDGDLRPLLGLKTLEEAWYVVFRGQTPKVDEMAKAHPAFVGVYENKISVDEMYSRN